MRVLVHDYSGHPFQAQLSRELASRGNTVDHVYCASYVSGKGRLEREPGDSQSLTFVALDLGRSFDKYTLRRRVTQEYAYARSFLQLLDTNRPDVVLMCNVPLLAHSIIERHTKRMGVPTVFWHQDVYSHAIGAEARRRFGPFGRVVAVQAQRLERKISRRADAVVVISDHFRPVHERWGTPSEKVHVLANWGPLDEVTPRERDNPWARSHDLERAPVLLYSGTLGLKHDPQRLVDLLRGVRHSLPDAQLVVVSEGAAADMLSERNEPGLTVLPFQAFAELPDVLGSGDVLVTILEPEASHYSVPSKTLTYLCAGRPVVALLPEANPAHRLVRDSGGLPLDLSVVEMSVASALVADLLADKAAIVDRGRRARAYAEANFGIQDIADRFETLLNSAAGPDRTPVLVTTDPETTRPRAVAEAARAGRV